MRIIILTGMSNTGKSTTLNLLYNLIVPKIGVSHGNRAVLGNPIQSDFSETINYQTDLLEFYTMGDYPQKLRLAIQHASKRNINIFICACSKLDSKLIHELQLHRTAFISKSISVNTMQQITFNTADAITILNLI
jgi:ABC-type multidrug transport system ATPase subunit